MKSFNNYNIVSPRIRCCQNALPLNIIPSTQAHLRPTGLIAFPNRLKPSPPTVSSVTVYRLLFLLFLLNSVLALLNHNFYDQLTSIAFPNRLRPSPPTVSSVSVYHLLFLSFLLNSALAFLNYNFYNRLTSNAERNEPNRVR